MLYTMKGLTVVSLNVRSLYSKLDELYIRFREFDIMCFSETWTNATYTDEMLEMKGYTIFRLDRDSNIGIHKRGGGLITYVSDKISKYVSVIDYGCQVSSNLEQLFIKLDKPNVKGQIFGNIYRPPSGKVSEFIAELSSTVKKIQETSHSEITILGDYNINYNLRHTQAFKQLKDFEREFNLSQEIKVSTRIAKSSSTCIDLICTNMEYIISKGTLDIHISDHLPVFIIKKKEKDRPQKSSFIGRSYTKYNKIDYQYDIRNHIGWRNFWVTKETDPIAQWEVILDIITETADLHCPKKKMRFRNDSPEWITKDMIFEISHKDYLYSKAKSTNDPSDWENFRKKKNEVKKLLSTAKEDHIKEKLNDLNGNPRKFWRVINEMSGTGKNSTRGKGCTKIEDDQGTIYENAEAAEFLNNYYVNIGPTLAQNHQKLWDESRCNIETDSAFSFSWINENELKKQIKDIKITKSSAVDGLSTRLLKDAFETITLELTYMYNNCLQNGIFPICWGISLVTPIPKTNTGSKKPGDWRPISQISLPGKILEKIIHTQLYTYLNNNNLLSPHQYGVRKGMSTSMAIFDVVKALYTNWNGKEYSGCVFIDFSKAFDTIDHNILFRKLKLYGLDQNSINFFKMYMTNRSQKTTVNGCTSTVSPITYGTAQGSILGPLIFILYVNDMFRSVNITGELFMYADDTLVLCKAEKIEDIIQICTDSLEKLSVWCEANKLSMNYNKTKFMLVKHKKTNDITDIKIGDRIIGQVHSYEYLGVLLDESLCHNGYIDRIYKKTNTKLGILSRIRRFISERTALNIYKTMIRPHLDYIDFVVDSGSVNRISQLDKLQNEAIRRIEYCINPDKRKEMGELHVCYNIEKLTTRRKRNLLKIIYKESKDITNVDYRRPQMELRSKCKVKKEK